MLAKARVRLPQAELVQAHPEHLPFADGAFDAAIAADAFHLVDDQRAALAQLLRVVRRGGPVALWFTVFSRDADVLAHRGAASRLLGLSPVPEPLSGGFRSFYAAPFAGRSLRVVPRILDTTVAGWIGFERTRAEVWAAYGERADAWYDALEAELVRAYGRTEARMRVPCVQYVYVGRV
jgi:SAM-dependent methyltransferase